MARQLLNVRTLTSVLAAMALATSFACSSSSDETGAPETGMAADMGGMEGMPAMGTAGGMTNEMQAHMQRMAGVQPDSLSSMVPLHRQMVANMLAQMNREMRDMNMEGDSAWTATVDSLRGDLRMMRDMGGRELAALMPSHRARVVSLMDMHRAMMNAMAR